MPEDSESFVLANDLLKSLGENSQPDSAKISSKKPDENCNCAAAGTPNSSCNFLLNPKFPDAKFSFGGFFLFDNSLLQLANLESICVSTGTPKFKIESICGAPPCLWNLDWYQARTLLDGEKISTTIKNHIEKFKRNDFFVLEFDNPEISENDVEDFVGNLLLNSFSEMPKFGVAVASEALANYVKKSFPRAKVFADENKVIFDEGRGNVDYYRDSASRFEKVSLHPSDASDFEFLKKLAAAAPAEKIEIPLNDTCSRNCTARKEYLSILAKIRRAPMDGKFIQERLQIIQKLGSEDVRIEPPPRGNEPAALSKEEFLRAYELGFRNFKIRAEKLRSEIAFLWQCFSIVLNDDPEIWHKSAATLAALSMNVLEAVPVVKTGIGAFKMRKF